jgi:hypothetical protein
MLRSTAHQDQTGGIYHLGTRGLKNRTSDVGVNIFPCFAVSISTNLETAKHGKMLTPTSEVLFFRPLVPR